MFESSAPGEPCTLRQPCKGCGGESGYLVLTNGQDVARCGECNAYQYCAPKSETGKEQRSVRTREAISPSVRWTVIDRARGHCEVCGATDRILHVAHLLSVEDGREDGWTDEQLNRPANLGAFCEECNLGQGRQSIDPVLYLALWRRRVAPRLV